MSGTTRGSLQAWLNYDIWGTTPTNIATNVRTCHHAHDIIWKSKSESGFESTACGETWDKRGEHLGRATPMISTLPIDYRHDDNRQWEVGIHIDSLEFHSSSL